MIEAQSIEATALVISRSDHRPSDLRSLRTWTIINSHSEEKAFSGRILMKDLNFSCQYYKNLEKWKESGKK